MNHRERRVYAHPPGLSSRLWHRRLGMELPWMESRRWVSDWVRLLPYSWRTLHHAYAFVGGFFWLPCDLCGQPFGGHESGGTIPDPTHPPYGGVTICSRCTKQRNAS